MDSILTPAACPPARVCPRIPSPYIGRSGVVGASTPVLPPLPAASSRLQARPVPRRLLARASSEAATAAAGPTGEAAASYASLAAAPLVPFVDPESGSPASFPAASGVYAVYDKDGVLQYMGLSRRLNASLAIHAADLPELCGSVKLLPVRAPEKNVLVEAWKQWMEEHVAEAGGPPPGNVSGNTTWTTRKASRAAKPEIRLTPGRNTQLTVPLSQLVDQVVRENKVVAFVKGTRTAPQCGFSHRVLTILNESGVDYEVLNVLDEEHNPGLREVIKEFSQWPTIPQIYVAGEFLGGADILDEMATSGQLKELLKKVAPRNSPTLSQQLPSGAPSPSTAG